MRMTSWTHEHLFHNRQAAPSIRDCNPERPELPAHKRESTSEYEDPLWGRC